MHFLILLRDEPSSGPHELGIDQLELDGSLRRERGEIMADEFNEPGLSLSIGEALAQIEDLHFVADVLVGTLGLQAVVKLELLVGLHYLNCLLGPSLCQHGSHHHVSVPLPFPHLLVRYQIGAWGYHVSEVGVLDLQHVLFVLEAEDVFSQAVLDGVDGAFAGGSEVLEPAVLLELRVDQFVLGHVLAEGDLAILHDQTVEPLYALDFIYQLDLLQHLLSLHGAQRDAMGGSGQILVERVGLASEGVLLAHHLLPIMQRDVLDLFLDLVEEVSLSDEELNDLLLPPHE
jgi:hypothetical protein